MYILYSLANISVFVMSHANFGYYIHGEMMISILSYLTNDKRKAKYMRLEFSGKSAHGAADTDMAGLLGQLQVPFPSLFPSPMKLPAEDK